MRLALSEISTVGSTFADDVVAYAAAGFDAIGIWEFKLPDDDDANIALLREHGLAVAVCVPVVPSILPLGIPGMEGPADPAERVASLCASMQRLSRYAPETVACLTGPLGDRTLGEGRAYVVEAIRVIAEAARPVDVRVGFEPIHRSQRETTSFVNSIEDALAILTDAGADDVGILLDTYHVWDDPALWDLIARASYRITGVHVADWPADATRSDRELAGLGISKTNEIVEALALSGWDGTLDVEIFGDPERFWGLPVDEAARQAHAAVSALVAA
ncbi:MAG: sugar phosphate isomerase/epimerase family protein [Gaiellales bacterium]